MPTAFPISIDQVVDLLKLERDPKTAGRVSYNVRCPFCDGGESGKYHMNINLEKNVYFCPKCMDAMQRNTGALDLYGRVRYGTPLRSNGKELFHKLSLELELNGYQREARPRQRAAEILPAGDEKLNLAYRALLNLPYLALSEEHLKNLRKRGVDETTARKHGYATLPEAKKLLDNHARSTAARGWYEKNKAQIEAVREHFPAYVHDEHMLAGLLIASDLEKKNVPLDHVPGFFRLLDHWCFRYMPGMLIPTVSYEGCIVGMQIRLDDSAKSKLRYMTVSAKGFPEGVTSSIARMHVSREQESRMPSCEVFLTEGPLKADVALALWRTFDTAPRVILAVQGVNNVRELPEIAEKLVRDGIKEITLALDMDRLGNTYVARAEDTIAKICREHGLRVFRLYWDLPYALAKERELKELCWSKNLTVPQKGSSFANIAEMAETLSKNQIEFDIVVNPDGIREKCHWRSETKGIDDYLLTEYLSHSTH